ncbi:uncharacterized protein LOC129761534 [Toxorhynchites rutilus septentrionalis]|uniref:uncharacterized protein LOC129761534 n=1 Tax=Toxorhynchites rutilus septentrionalis TaxID=329112 RepID=UPI00247A4C43|nr:uncharacterized protein LOC129761534 [Toxorhynchites rutilus septentrionalis]
MKLFYDSKAKSTNSCIWTFTRPANDMTRSSFVFIALLILATVNKVLCQDLEFAPHVTATCKSNAMNIRIQLTSPYNGVVHARDFRTPACMTFGNGSAVVTLSLNLLAKQGSSEYCGILISNMNGGERSEERSVQLAVRVHKTLELADDKFYVITCGKTGFARDDNSPVALKFFENDRRIQETVYGRKYTVKAEVTHPNGTQGIRVKNCFAFNKKNSSIALIDERGCSVINSGTTIMTRFKTASNGTTAVAMLNTMFRFPEGSEVHIQCDVVQCNGLCPVIEDSACLEDASVATNSGRTLGQAEEGILLAASTIFILDPIDAKALGPLCEDNSVRPHWLLWLTIALAVLFLIMLLMNIFLCTAMSCSCARTEIIEKEPSIIEEYDPYRSWHGSQYGSRYSLHGRDGGHNKGYTSGGSTIHSNRSLPIDSDHYAIVHSRPGSRHSGLHGHRPRGPSSNM